MTRQPEYVRSRSIGRVFQDPRAGTAPDMTIEENLAISLLRAKRSGLRMGVTNKRRAVMREQLSRLGMGLEDRLKAGVNKLSGGQRQAMSLLMATIAEPSLLLARRAHGGARPQGGGDDHGAHRRDRRGASA